MGPHQHEEIYLPQTDQESRVDEMGQLYPFFF